MQAKTHVPYSSIERMSKRDIKGQRLTQRVHGAIIHGTGGFMFVFDGQIAPKGANQGYYQLSEMLICLYFALIHSCHCIERMHFSLETQCHTSFHPSGWMQRKLGKNCSGVWTLACCLWAFRRSPIFAYVQFVTIFETNPMTGLPVGHTHEDIDQAFSVLSRALIGQKAPIILNTREEFDKFISTKVRKYYN